MPKFPQFSGSRATDRPAPFAVEFHLLSTLPYDDFLALQRRLAYEAGGQEDGRIVVLVCEHPWLISVGRRGSRGHIRLTNEQLRARQLRVRWVSRGGGCVLHGPGQVAVYPITPLDRHGWTVGEYLARLQQGIAKTLSDLCLRPTTFPPSFGIWGRSGQLASCCVAVRNGISCHGVFVNVNPMMTNFSFVDVVPPEEVSEGQKSTMGCLAAERRQAISVPKVRAALIPNLAAALGTDHYHLTTGHPLLVTLRKPPRESRHRAS